VARALSRRLGTFDGEDLWNRDVFRNWKTYLAHALLPDGQNVFDFGDIWEGALTARRRALNTRASIQVERCKAIST
jgi:hypothetical protein